MRVGACSPFSVQQGLVAQLRPLWAAFDDAVRALDAEAGRVTEALAGLEEALARKSLFERIADGAASRI
ncbi:hypothetical protein LZK98_17630 [Sphingomonas cannabina]|uniref:hypothetical protein n=1 Tax=Sphingomonas cannabina TaxID=2899123 RepID=UPI001F326A92|nr:hypothetical protein [Sphingomonas cannabina]UIJ47510.1 hypothetical protein LZK98_17630 [Sphingomonas cannabina]